MTGLKPAVKGFVSKTLLYLDMMFLHCLYVGQTVRSELNWGYLFSDMDANLDHIVPVCQKLANGQCKDSAIYIHSDGKVGFVIG